MAGLRKILSEESALDDKKMLAFLQRRDLVAAGADLHSDPAASEDHLIPTVDVYAMEPWNVQDVLVAEAAKTGTPAVERDRSIFFTPRKRALGNRCSRTAGGGYWRDSRKQEIKNSSNELIGIRAFLKYQFFCSDDEVDPGSGDAGRENKGKRKAKTALKKISIPTEYIMYEYTVNSFSSDFQGLALCFMKISSRGGASRAECEAAPKRVKVAVHISDGPRSDPAASPSTSTAFPDGQRQSVLPRVDEVRTSDTMARDEGSLYGLAGLSGMGMDCEDSLFSPSTMSNRRLLDDPTVTGIPAEVSGECVDEELFPFLLTIEDDDPTAALVTLVTHSSDLYQSTTEGAGSVYVSSCGDLSGIIRTTSEITVSFSNEGFMTTADHCVATANTGESRYNSDLKPLLPFGDNMHTTCLVGEQGVASTSSCGTATEVAPTSLLISAAVASELPTACDVDLSTTTGAATSDIFADLSPLISEDWTLQESVAGVPNTSAAGFSAITDETLKRIADAPSETEEWKNLWDTVADESWLWGPTWW